MSATAHRLLRALEDLGRSEEIALARGDGAGFLALQSRAEPLVLRLADLSAAGAIDASAHERGRRLVEDRHQRQHRLTAMLSSLRDDIDQLDRARHRAHCVRPAYAARPARRPSGVFAFQA